MAQSKTSATNFETYKPGIQAAPPHRTRGKPLPITEEAAPSTQGTAPSYVATADSARTTQAAIDDHSADKHAHVEARPAAYAIGYKKPPMKTRFRPGQSGNPKGRAKGSRNTRTIFEEESQKQVAVTENGKTIKLSKRELVVKTIVNKAAKGDEKAQVKFLRLDERYSPVPSSAGSPGTPETASPAELSAADKIILLRYRELHGLKDPSSNSGDGNESGAADVL